MLRIISAGVMTAVGLYLLNEAKSDNCRARDDYDDTVHRSKKKVKKSYKKAKKRDNLDKLNKLKKAKVKVADTIYKNLKSEQDNYTQINYKLKDLKLELNSLFGTKRASSTREEKQTIQKSINIVIESRKELFAIKDTVYHSVLELKERVREANREVKMIQNQINYILDR